MSVEIADEQLLSNLRELAEELGEVPRAQDVSDYFDHSASSYRSRFGSWNEARKAAGLPKRGTWQDGEPYHDEERLRELYLEEDMSQREIGEMFDVAGGTIGKWLDKYDIEKDLTDPRKDEETLRELYWDEEMTIYEIAEELGTYRNVVHGWMVDLGIDRRPGNDYDYPWQDAETLRMLYSEREMTIKEIAEMFRTTPQIISRWMDEYNIVKRSPRERAIRSKGVNRAYFHTTKPGYEIVGSRCGEETHTVFVHKLVAVAEHGFDAVEGKVVHHRNEVPWDNRPSNLEVMSDSDHKRHHAVTRGEVPPEGS